MVVRKTLKKTGRPIAAGYLQLMVMVFDALSDERVVRSEMTVIAKAHGDEYTQGRLAGLLPSLYAIVMIGVVWAGGKLMITLTSAVALPPGVGWVVSLVYTAITVALFGAFLVLMRDASVAAESGGGDR